MELTDGQRIKLKIMDNWILVILGHSGLLGKSCAFYTASLVRMNYHAASVS